MAIDKVNQFTDAFNKSVEMHVKKAIDGLEFNKTEVVEIVDTSNAKVGDYVVSNGSARYHAYSNETTYTKGTKVYVLIPNNDYGQQKLILNKAKRNADDTEAYESPLTNFSPGTENILEIFDSENSENNKYRIFESEYKQLQDAYNGNVFKLYGDNVVYQKDDLVYVDGRVFRCVDDNGATLNYNDVSDSWIVEQSLSLRLASALLLSGSNYDLGNINDFYNPNMASTILANYNGKNVGTEGELYKLVFLSRNLENEELFNKSYKYLGLEATFRTAFNQSYSIFSGNYGIKILILYSRKIHDNSQQREYFFGSGVIDTKDMIGSIYNFSSGHTQEALFELECENADDVRICQIAIFLFQDGNFKATNIENASRIPEVYPYYNKDTSVLLDDNIFISDLNIRLGNDRDETYDFDTVRIYSENGLFYDAAQAADSAITKTIKLEWTHVNPNDTTEETTFTSVPRIITNVVNNSKPTITWFRSYYDDVEDYRSQIQDEVNAYDRLYQLKEDYMNFQNRMYADNGTGLFAKYNEIVPEEEKIDVNSISENEIEKINRFFAWLKTDSDAQPMREEIERYNSIALELIADLGLREDKHYYYDRSTGSIIMTESGYKIIDQKINRDTKGYKNFLSSHISVAGQGWIPIEQTKANTLSIDFVPDRNLSNCKVKCVIEYGPYQLNTQEESDWVEYDTTNPYYRKLETNELVFVNYSLVPDIATKDASVGMQFTYEDGTRGSYPFYDYYGRIIEKNNATRTRKLETDLLSSYSGKTYLNGSETLIWKIPKHNTMIYVEDLYSTDYNWKRPALSNSNSSLYEENTNYSVGTVVYIQSGSQKKYYIALNNTIGGLTADADGKYSVRYDNWLSYDNLVYPTQKVFQVTEEQYNLGYKNIIKEDYDSNYYYLLSTTNTDAESTNQIAVEDLEQYIRRFNKEYNWGLTESEILAQIEKWKPVRNYIRYKIKEIYKPYICNNLINTYLIKNGQLFKGSTTLTFSNKDNTGTNYSLMMSVGERVNFKEQIDINEINTYSIKGSDIETLQNGRITVLKNKDWNIIGGPQEAISLDESDYHRIIFSLVDIDGREVGLTNEEKNAIIKLWVEDKQNSYYSGYLNKKYLNFLVKKENNNYIDIAVKANSSATLQNLQHIVLQVSVTTDRGHILNNEGGLDEINGTKLTALLPLCFRKSNVYVLSGTNMIYYNEFGALVQTGFTKYNISKTNEIISNDMITFGVGAFKGNNVTGTYTAITAPEINNYPKFRVKDNEYILEPNPYYISNLSKEICIDITINGEVCYTLPLIMIQNTHQIPVLNEWNGSLKVDNENNFIGSATMAAGTKDSENNFTGILMGEFSRNNQAGDNSSAKVTGLFGYKDGSQSFGFSSDGTAFIGKSGSGRIKFDGSSGAIESANYVENQSGTRLDLDDGTLTAAKFHFKGGIGSVFEMGQNDANYGYFKIDVANNEFILKNIKCTNLQVENKQIGGLIEFSSAYMGMNESGINLTNDPNIAKETGLKPYKMTVVTGVDEENSEYFEINGVKVLTKIVLKTLKNVWAFPKNSQDTGSISITVNGAKSAGSIVIGEEETDPSLDPSQGGTPGGGN